MQNQVLGEQNTGCFTDKLNFLLRKIVNVLMRLPKCKGEGGDSTTKKSWVQVSPKVWVLVYFHNSLLTLDTYCMHYAVCFAR